MNPMRYLMGSRVYRGASNAPTRGTVDPMGYINRSLNLASPVGGDGLSDKRSGLAQAALSRLRMGSGGMPYTQRTVLNSQRPTVASPVLGGPRNPADFMSADPNMQQFQGTPQGVNNLRPLGHTVSATGQLLPNSGTPQEDTSRAMFNAPPNPQQLVQHQAALMQAARDRMQHQINTKEALARHQLNMQKLTFDGEHHIHRHRTRMRGVR